MGYRKKAKPHEKGVPMLACLSNQKLTALPRVDRLVSFVLCALLWIQGVAPNLVLADGDWMADLSEDALRAVLDPKMEVIPIPEDAPEKTPTIEILFYDWDTPQNPLPLEKPPAGMKVMTPEDCPLIVTEDIALKVGEAYVPIQQEGMYVIISIQPPKDVPGLINVIRYSGDVWRLAAHLSRLHIHGYGTNQDPNEKKTEQARRSRIHMTCGDTCKFLMYHFETFGIKARENITTTMSSYNNYDNGHNTLEIFDPVENRWIFYDADIGCLLRFQGRRLNLGEAMLVYRNGLLPEIERIASVPMLQSEGLSSRYFEPVYSDPGQLHRWYSRVLQGPRIKPMKGESPVIVERVRSHSTPSAGDTDLTWRAHMKQIYGDDSFVDTVVQARIAAAKKRLEARSAK
jgi:hypothetical protein